MVPVTVSAESWSAAPAAPTAATRRACCDCDIAPVCGASSAIAACSASTSCTPTQACHDTLCRHFQGLSWVNSCIHAVVRCAWQHNAAGVGDTLPACSQAGTSAAMLGVDMYQQARLPST